MPLMKVATPLSIIALLAAVTAPMPARADEWPPVSPEELKMTSEPLAPGAPAIILDRQVDRDDSGPGTSETRYYRIKIFTEEGREQANVEVPFYKQVASVQGIKGRTIHPDGSISTFSGQPYEKTVVKARGVKYLAKVFTLPDVRAGDVIEYRYTLYLEQYGLFNSRWDVSEGLFTKHARFNLRPYPQPYRCMWQGLPPGTPPPHPDRTGEHMEVQNVPALQEEEYMPPKDELGAGVDFIYSDNTDKDFDKFWKQEGKRLFSEADAFVNKRKAMEEVVGGIVSPGDTPEAKLRKIYARVQTLRNLSYEKEKTTQEERREKLKSEENVESVWKHGYGDGPGLTWLFLGLARGVGFQAWPVMVSDRYEHFFHPKMLNARELDASVVLVRLNGQDLYFDPGSKFTPYGLLPWDEAGVPGLRLDKDGGDWIKTPIPSSDASAVERKADLKLDETGTLAGKLTVTYTGLEASWRRYEERFEDATQRKKFLEDEVKGWVPATIEIELLNQPEWEGSAQPLEAEFHLKVPGWVSGARRRALLPVGLFSGSEKRTFEHATRLYDIYFPFPFGTKDNISVELPSGWRVGTLPKGQNIDAPFCKYETEAESSNEIVRLSRAYAVHGYYADKKFYDALRGFYQSVRLGDEQQIILQPGSAAAAQ
jgi:hypothetical protein